MGTGTKKRRDRKEENQKLLKIMKGTDLLSLDGGHATSASIRVHVGYCITNHIKAARNAQMDALAFKG